MTAGTFDQAQVLWSGASRDGDLAQGAPGIHQQRRGAAGSVTRNLSFAAVRIKQANGRVANQNPAIRADAGVAITDRTCQCRQVSSRYSIGPAQQKVVSRAVRFDERDGHASVSLVDFNHRLAMHHDGLNPIIAWTGFESCPLDGSR